MPPKFSARLFRFLQNGGNRMSAQNARAKCSPEANKHRHTQRHTRIHTYTKRTDTHTHTRTHTHGHGAFNEFPKDFVVFWNSDFQTVFHTAELSTNSLRDFVVFWNYDYVAPQPAWHGRVYYRQKFPPPPSHRVTGVGAPRAYKL